MASKTTDEIANMTCDENTSTLDLLLMINHGLTNGALMTRANLAFYYLCERLGHNSFDFNREDEDDAPA